MVIYGCMQPSPMRIFFVADLNAKGDVQDITEYTYSQLELLPGAGDLIVHFATELWRNPEEFELALPRDQKHLKMRWRATADSAGICTLRSGEQLASMGLLATGKNSEADRLTLDAFQKHLLR